MVKLGLDSDITIIILMCRNHMLSLSLSNKFHVGRIIRHCLPSMGIFIPWAAIFMEHLEPILISIIPLYPHSFKELMRLPKSIVDLFICVPFRKDYCTHGEKVLMGN